jgi:hypothetical protein
MLPAEHVNFGINYTRREPSADEMGRLIHGIKSFDYDYYLKEPTARPHYLKALVQMESIERRARTFVVHKDYIAMFLANANIGWNNQFIQLLMIIP